MNLKICVIGLGYVGLPIFLKLSKFYETIGFDKDKKRINELKKGNDYNLEYSKADLLNNENYLKLTSNPENIKKYNFFIVAVPTPIFKNKNPDLRILSKSCKLIGKVLKKDDIVFFESTVYPGVTNNLCRKILENTSKLKSSKDFFLGYSPERINPGDKTKKLNGINKIVAFNNKDPKRVKLVKNIFKKVSKRIAFTNNLESAETAKVIENIQRDLNIGLMKIKLLS